MPRTIERVGRAADISFNDMKVFSQYNNKRCRVRKARVFTLTENYQLESWYTFLVEVISTHNI